MKKAGIAALIFVAFFATFLISKGYYFYKTIYTKRNGIFSKPVEPKTAYNILLLGYGGPGHDGPYLTDSMMVAHIDLKTNKVALLSLPRDIWVLLPTKSKEAFHSKINAVYQTGLFPKDYPDVNVPSVETDLIKGAVKTITGLSIDAYLAIDFAGFTKAIDILEGVDVNVVKTFDDYEYPLEDKEKDLCEKDAEFEQVKKFLELGYDEEEKKRLFAEKPELELFFKNITDDPKEAFPCRYEHLHFDAGKVHMDGTTALKYVRSRHSLQDGSDFGRAARQQQFVKAVKEKVISIGFVTKVIPLLDEMKKHIRMDISPDALQTFVKEAKDASSYKTISIRMSDQDFLKSSYSEYGGYILIPRSGADNWTEIHKMIKNGIAEITPTPSLKPTLSPIPTGKIIK